MAQRIAAALPFVLAAVALAVARPDQPKPLSGVVPAGSRAFISLDVAKAWDHASFGGVREARGKVEFAWLVQSLLGVAPADLARATAFWTPSGKELPFVLITGRKALDAQAIAKTLTRAGAKIPPQATGKAIAAPGAEFPFVLQVDAQTVLLAPPGADPASLENLGADKKGRLAAAIAEAGNHTLTIGIDVAAIAQLPLPVGGPLLEAETAVLVADLGEKTVGTAELKLNFTDAEKAARAAPFLKTKLSELAGLAGAQEQRATEKPQEGTGYPAPLLDWIGRTLKGARVKADGTTARVTAELKLDEGISALLTAIPDAALAGRGASAAENNMKQITLAIINYADANGGRMPANTYDSDGKPLLSWRVQILPYIEQSALYQRFKLDEAWDSDHNKPLSRIVVKAFQVPGRPAPQPWETYFRGFIGPENVKAEHRPWLRKGPKNQAKFPADFPDGTSNTWLVVEAAEAVPWAKPDDLPYDGVLPLPKLGGANGTYVVGYADGHTATYRRGQIDEKNMRGLITASGGEVVVIPDR
jgi:hypothetical protein